MTFRIAQRLIALLTLPLLLFGTNGDVLGRHPCAHHDGPAAAATAGHHAAHDSAPTEEEHESCTCVGTCSFGTAPPTPSVAITFSPPASVVRIIRPASISPDVELQPRFLIPFATAPPPVA